VDEKIAIRVEGLTRYYGDLLAVDHITFQVQGGEIFGFLGPNGAGKTTTIRMLVGLTTPDEGRAWVNGYNVEKEPLPVKASVGVVPERSNLYDELSCYDNLQFMGQLYGVPRKERRVRTEGLLRQFRLWDRKDERFAHLSRGLRRRLTIAAALIHAPPLLFLDEPTVGLDVMSARALRRQIKELNRQGISIFLTTHLIAEAEALCDRVAILVEGRLKALGTPASLCDVGQEGEVLEIALTRIDPGTVEALQGCAGVQEVYGTQAGVRLHLVEMAAALPEVIRCLEALKAPILSLNTIKPTLEDAFVALTGLDAEVMLLEKENRRRR
jgi:ABC-2 type transport system ATP-binding protein